MNNQKLSLTLLLLTGWLVMALAVVPVSAQLAPESHPLASSLEVQPRHTPVLQLYWENLFNYTNNPSGSPPTHIFPQSTLAARAALALFTPQNPANPQQPAPQNPQQPEGGLTFKVPENIPVPKVGQPYSYSLCTGKELPIAQAQQCRPIYSTTVTGGRAASYVFRLQFGEYLPPGLTLDPYTGVIHGTPTTAAQGPFNVCVQQLNLQPDCRQVTLRPGPQVQGQQGQGQPARRGGSSAKTLGIGLGVAAGAAAAVGASGILKPKDGGNGPKCGDPCSRPAPFPATTAQLNDWCRTACNCSGGWDAAAQRCRP